MCCQFSSRSRRNTASVAADVVDEGWPVCMEEDEAEATLTL